MPVTLESQRRRVQRHDSDRSIVKIELKDGMGHPRWVTGGLLDRSEHGIGVALMTPLKPGRSIVVIGRLTRIEPKCNGELRLAPRRQQRRLLRGLEFIDAESGSGSGHQVAPSDPLEFMDDSEND